MKMDMKDVYSAMDKCIKQGYKMGYEDGYNKAKEELMMLIKQLIPTHNEE